MPSKHVQLISQVQKNFLNLASIGGVTISYLSYLGENLKEYWTQPLMAFMCNACNTFLESNFVFLIKKIVQITIVNTYGVALGIIKTTSHWCVYVSEHEFCLWR